MLCLSLIFRHVSKDFEYFTDKTKVNFDFIPISKSRIIKNSSPIFSNIT